MGIISKYKTFLHWLATYFIVFMVPFAFIIFTYFYSISIIRSESFLHKKINQNQLRNMIDFQITEVEKITNQLVWDRQIRLYLKSDELDENLRTRIEYKIRELRYLNDMIYQIYIVNEEKETAADGRIIPDNFPASCIDWEKIYNDREKTVYLRDVDKTSEGEELYFITKFFMLEEGKSDQYLVVFLNREQLADSIRQVEWIDRGAGYVIDSDGGVVASVVNVAPNEKIIEGYPSFLEEYGSVTDYFEIEKGGHVASVIRSSILDWYYVIVTSKPVYFGRILDFQKTVLLVLFLVLVSGLLLSTFFTRRYYLQIRELRQLFSGSSIRQIYKKYLDEFDILENEIKSVITENLNIKKTLTGSNMGLKRIFLRRLITGEDFDSSVFNDLCSLCGISFVHTGFCAVLIDAESGENLFFSLESVLGEKAEMLEKQYNAYYVTYTGRNVLVLNIDNSSDSSTLSSSLDRVLTFIREGNTHDTIISAGRIYDSVSGIPVSYSEALKVLEYKTILGDKNIFLFDDLLKIQKTTKFKYISFLENEYKIYNLLTARKYGEAKTLLEREIDLVEDLYRDVEILKLRLAGFQNILIESLNVLMKSSPESLKIWGKKIMECRSFPKLRELLESFFGQLDSLFPDKNTDMMAQSAKKYIETNFMKKELSITEIAEKLGVTPQHLSKIFKQVNGTGLLQYINHCRIEEAKTILNSEDEINIKETAGIVGYYNEITFIRNFKALTGISPGQYKSSLPKNRN